MADEWEDWIIQRKKEGYSRQEVKEYLAEQGYDPAVVDRHWGQPAETDVDAAELQREQEMVNEPRDEEGQDMTRAELDDAQRNAMDRGSVPAPLSEQPSPSTFKDTALNLLSSPAGFFRRGSLRIVDALLFAGVALAVSFVLDVTGGYALRTAVASLLGLEGIGLAGMLLGAVMRLLKFVGFSIALTIYYFIALMLLGGKGTPQDTLAVVLYSSVQLLFGWLPVIGGLAWLVTMYVQFFGLKEIHNTSTLGTLAVLLLPYLVLAGFVLMVLVGATAALLAPLLAV